MHIYIYCIFLFALKISRRGLLSKGTSYVFIVCVMTREQKRHSFNVDDVYSQVQIAGLYGNGISVPALIIGLRY